MVMLNEKLQIDISVLSSTVLWLTMTNNASPLFPCLILESSSCENADFAVIKSVTYFHAHFKPLLLSLHLCTHCLTPGYTHPSLILKIPFSVLPYKVCCIMKRGDWHAPGQWWAPESGFQQRRHISTGVLTYCSGPETHFPQPTHTLLFQSQSEHTSELVWVICLQMPCFWASLWREQHVCNGANASGCIISRQHFEHPCKFLDPYVCLSGCLCLGACSCGRYLPSSTQW